MRSCGTPVARRYALQGMNISPDGIVITAGALEALNLQSAGSDRAGRLGGGGKPCFYGALQALERLRLKALSVATDVKEGIDLTALEAAPAKLPGQGLLVNDQRAEPARLYA